VAQAGATETEVRVEPLVLPAGADAEVGSKPTAAVGIGVDATADANAGDEGRLGDDDTSSGTLEDHYQTELP
jgi:hypothetical protein